MSDWAETYAQAREIGKRVSRQRSKYSFSGHLHRWLSAGAGTVKQLAATSGYCESVIFNIKNADHCPSAKVQADMVQAMGTIERRHIAQWQQQRRNAIMTDKIDWAIAPEGATHYNHESKQFFAQVCEKIMTYHNGAWIRIEGYTIADIESAAATVKRPTPAKRLTQAVFNGLSSEYRWAAVDRDGDCFVFGVIPEELDGYGWGCEHGTPSHYIGEDYDATDWENSLIEREESITDVARSIEAARVDERKHGHYYKDVSDVTQIDVYAVLRLFEVTDPCLQHIVKKALCAGKRGAKDFAKDVQEIADTAARLVELEAGK